MNNIHIGLLSKNTVIYAAGNISMRAASFLLIPLYTHSLSMKDYGLLVTLLITIQIMITIMGIGSGNAFIRFAKEYEIKNLLGRLLGSTIVITLLGGAVVIGFCTLFLIPFFQLFMPTNEEIGTYVLMAGLVALSQCLWGNIVCYFRVKDEALKFMVANLVSLLVLFCLNWITLRVWQLGIAGALIAQIATYGCSWLVISMMVVSKTGLGVSKALVGKLIKFGFPLIFAMSGDYVTDATAFYFLGYFASLEQVALYSLGYKIAQISSMVLILPFHLAYGPFVYANIKTPGIQDTISKVLTYLMLCFAFVALGIAYVTRDLLGIIAPIEYFAAYQFTFLMLPILAFRGIYYIGESLLYISHKTHIVGTIVSVFTLLSIPLNFAFIRIWGAYGAIGVFAIILIATSLVTLVLGIKNFTITVEWRRLIKVGLMLSAFLISTFLLFNMQVYLYHSIIPIMAIAAFVFLYHSSFFNDLEKRFIKEWFHKCHLKFAANFKRSL
jgi:O-antigen/teichoic acid export membrane protein